jgi:hypothetical protein
MARPLIKKDQNGTLYTRPAIIEAAIDEALQDDLDTLIRRAKIPKRSSPGFLPLECLVHLIRDARRRGDQRTMSGLMPSLLGRCEAILRVKIPVDYLPNAEEIREEILGEFSVLFAEDGCTDTTNALDFYECRFNAAFRTFRLPYIKRERVRTDPLVLTPVQTESADDSTDDEFFARVSEAFRTPANQVDHVFRHDLMKAVDALPEDQCKAVMLCYFYELPEESDDPSVLTAASLCGVTGRTIRYRLRRAIAAFSKQFNKQGEAHP